MPNLNLSSAKTMFPKINSTELFDEDSAAAYIGGIKVRTIRAWRANRGLPFIRITAKTIRIRRADLDDWLARHCVAIS
jgi:excisionase family DNA binding protein